MKRRVISLIFILAGVGLAYGIYQYQRGPVSIQNTKSDITLQPTQLLKEFNEDESAANEKYLDKIIELEGSIQSIQNKADNYQVSLSTGDPMNSVNCSFEKGQDLSEYKEGDDIKFKAKCTGFLMGVELMNGILLD